MISNNTNINPVIHVQKAHRPDLVYNQKRTGIKTDTGLVSIDERETLRSSVHSEISYSNKWAMISPEDKIFTSQSGDDGLSPKDYLKTLTSNPLLKARA